MPGSRDDKRDNLTGLFNRRTLEDRFAEAMDHAQNDGSVLSMIFLDIDHFKVVNDTHGHEVGDLVIKRVASVISESVSNPGIAARFGGEEFVVLVPGVEREQAFLMAEKLRESMDKPYQFGTNNEKVELLVTLSGGISAYPTDGRTIRDVLRKADQALYRAKSTGRNKICIAEEERMAAKTSHYTLTQLARLSRLAKEEDVGEAVLLREALDDLLTKYKVSDIES